MGKRGKQIEKNEENIAFVKNAVCTNMTREEIAKCLNITAKTLRKHFRFEILVAEQELKNKALVVLHDHLDKQSLDASKFVLARKAKWSERTEVTGADGKNLAPPTIQYVIAKDGD